MATTWEPVDIHAGVIINEEFEEELQTSKVFTSRCHLSLCDHVPSTFTTLKLCSPPVYSGWTSTATAMDIHSNIVLLRAE